MNGGILHTPAGYSDGMPTITYRVPGVSCAHCRQAIVDEVSAVAGVVAVEVDLEVKQVTVSGEALDEPTIVAAIDDAGYEVAP